MAFETAGFTPETLDAYNRLVAAAKARGIALNYNSGFRTLEDQRQLYENMLAGQRGQPLPYPNRGAVRMAATPGTSPHELGYAFDVSAVDPSRQGELNALGQSVGLKTIAGDPGHFQLASWHRGATPSGTSMAYVQPSGGSGPHPLDDTRPAGGSSGGPTSPVDLRTSVFQALVGRGLTPQQAMGAMYSMMGESYARFDPAAYNPNDPGGAIGFAQWSGLRRKDLQAMAARMGLPETDPSVQLALFNQEIGPSGKYAGVIDKMKQAQNTADATSIWTRNYEVPKVDNSATRYVNGLKAASLDANGAPVWNTPAASAVASNAPASAAPAQPQGPPKTVQEALQRLTAKDEKTGKSALENLGSVFSPNKDALAAAARMQPPSMPQAPADTGMASYEPAAQLLAATMQQSAKPLSWSTAPYGSGVAGPQQAPGMTLSSNPYSPYGPFGQIYNG